MDIKFLKHHPNQHNYTLDFRHFFALLFSCIALPILATPKALCQNIRAFNVYCNSYSGESGKLNPFVSINKIFIDELLTDHISESGWKVKVHITEIQGNSATKPNMLLAWEKFAATVQSDDTVFVHFSGHGAIASEKGPQLLQFCDDLLLSRDDWAKSIANLNCRLRIFTTDCCSSFIKVEVAEGDEEVKPWDSLYHLLMLHRGFVNITAASPGEDAWFTRRGGYFTVNLHSDMQRYKTWDRVFAECKKRVIIETRDQVGQVQTPFAHSLARPLPTAIRPLSVSYILPESDQRHLQRSELEALGLQQLYLARNEIVARHGYDFSTPLLRSYFSELPWYQKQKGKKSYQLSTIESKNAKLIQQIENEKGGPFIKYVDPNTLHSFYEIFPHSSVRPLPRTAVQSLNRAQLSIARNEIYARHGYPFKSQKLAEWFASNTGYSRKEDVTLPKFNQIEQQNIWLIKKVERIQGGPYKW